MPSTALTVIGVRVFDYPVCPIDKVLLQIGDSQDRQLASSLSSPIAPVLVSVQKAGHLVIAADRVGGRLLLAADVHHVRAARMEAAARRRVAGSRGCGPGSRRRSRRPSAGARLPISPWV